MLANVRYLYAPLDVLTQFSCLYASENYILVEVGDAGSCTWGGGSLFWVVVGSCWRQVITLFYLFWVKV